MNDNASWKIRLREGFKRRYPRASHAVDLPRDIDFVTEGDGVRMVMRRSVIEKGNMQNPPAAFEAWALALHGYAGAKAVRLDWEECGSTLTPHAWRFHFRAAHFARLFGDWFALARKPSRTMESGGRYLLNVESKPRTGTCPTFATTLKERKLEDVIARDPVTSGHFREAFGLDVVGQQLPVGVFKDEVSSKMEHALSPRAGAAVDLWGIGGEELHVFELKAFEDGGGLRPLGILSELFFYVLVMRAVQSGVVQFDAGTARSRSRPFRLIPATKTIQGWLLAPQLHPLLEYGDSPILDLLNAGFASAREPVTFRRALLSEAGTFKRR